MSRRCRAGQRARFIRTMNRGRIVVVVRPWLGEKVADAAWVGSTHPWVVTSLGAPLRARFHPSGEEAPPTMSMVADDRDLEPLRDDDGLLDDLDETLPRAEDATT